MKIKNNTNNKNYNITKIIKGLLVSTVMAVTTVISATPNTVQAGFAIGSNIPIVAGHDSIWLYSVTGGTYLANDGTKNNVLDALIEQFENNYEDGDTLTFQRYNTTTESYDTFSVTLREDSYYGLVRDSHSFARIFIEPGTDFPDDLDEVASYNPVPTNSNPHLMWHIHLGGNSIPVESYQYKFRVEDHSVSSINGIYEPITDYYADTAGGTFPSRTLHTVDTDLHPNGPVFKKKGENVFALVRDWSTTTQNRSTTLEFYSVNPETLHQGNSLSTYALGVSDSFAVNSITAGKNVGFTLEGTSISDTYADDDAQLRFFQNPIDLADAVESGLALGSNVPVLFGHNSLWLFPIVDGQYHGMTYNSAVPAFVDDVEESFEENYSAGDTLTFRKFNTNTLSYDTFSVTLREDSKHGIMRDSYLFGRIFIAPNTDFPDDLDAGFSPGQVANLSLAQKLSNSVTQAQGADYRLMWHLVVE